MRQHGDHTVHKVNGSPPLKRLDVQRAVLLHIIGHVRDMDSQLITLSLARQRNRIIQVLCILPVNRHGLPVPKIHPSFHIRGAHVLRHALRLL